MPKRTLFLLTVGGTALLVALFGPQVGLGTRDDFLFFKLLGIARRELFGFGLIGILTALVLWAFKGNWLLDRLPVWLRILRAALTYDIRPLFKAAAANLVVAVASMLVALLAFELGVRAVRGEWTVTNYVHRKVALLTVLKLNDYDPMLGWVLKPNMDGRKTTVTTGQYGVRMNSTAVRKPPVKGILAVGDSFTAGSEVLDHESWPAHIERMTGVPTNNGATGAWGTDQIVLRTEMLADALDPRVVIVSFLVDDILRAELKTHGGGNKPYFTVVDGRLVHHNFPVPPFGAKPSEIGLVRSVFGYSYLVNWVMETLGYTQWWLQGWVNIPAGNNGAEVTCLLLERLKQKMHQRGTRLILLLQYGGGQIVTWKDEPPYVRAVDSCARQIGIETENTWDALTDFRARQGEAAFKRLFVMRDDKIYGHMSNEGNEFIAQLLARRLKQ